MQRAAIYARVSSEKQEQERTIDSQVAALRDACTRAEVDVVGVYADDGVSGTTLARPALDRLRDDASKGTFDTVYILSPDRLARKYLFQALVLDELKRHRVQVMFLDKPVTERPEDQLLLGMQGLIAEYERAQIIERTRRGKLFKARSGEIQTTVPQFGYTVIRSSGAPKHYAVNEAQAAVVRLVFDLYVRYRSTIRVCEELHQRGIRTARGLEWWGPTNLTRLLHSEAYIGVAHYNKVAGNSRRRPRSEWVPIPVPPIVDPGVFALAQRLLAQNAGTRAKAFYLLSRIVRCANCGHLFIGNSGGGSQPDRRYYRCSLARSSFLREKGCDMPWIRAEYLEQAVLDALRRTVTTPAFADGLIRQRRSGFGRMSATKDVRRRIAMLREKRGRLVDLYVEGKIEKDEFASRQQSLDLAIEELAHPLATEHRTTTRWTQEQMRDQIKESCSRAATMLATVDSIELRYCLRLLIDSVVYDSRRGVAEINAHLFPRGTHQRESQAELSGSETLANSARSMKFVVTAEVPRRRSDRLRAVHA